MARFETDGLEDLISEMENAGVSLRGQIAQEMLQRGAQIVQETWKQTAREHGYKVTGAMIDSIGYARTPKQVGDVQFIDICPQGKDEDGTRNAEKAFLLHYGWSEYDGTHWVDEADEKCGDRVVDAMAQVFYSKTKGNS